MRPRRPSTEHQEAVSRRLALLSAELADARREGRHDDRPGEPDWTAGHTRIPDTGRPGTGLLGAGAPGAGIPDAGGVAEARDAAPPVPLPGRHASRRAGRAVATLVPETLRGRVLLGPAQVAVVAVLVTVALAATCWWLVRGDAHVVEAPRVTASSGSPLAPVSAVPGSASATGSGTGAGTVTVDVAGRVRHPGIAVLDAGSRVVDALAAAGGARGGVDLAGLNLARVLVDGEQILVGVPAASGVAASAVPTPGGIPAALVNLNTASETDLEALPEVGPVTAQAIIAWRTEHGGFSAVDELLEVDGIGDATLGQLAPYVTV